MGPPRLQPWLEGAAWHALGGSRRIASGVDQFLQVTQNQQLESGIVVLEISDSVHRLRAFLSRACAAASSVDREWGDRGTYFYIQSIAGELRSTPRPFRREPELVLWVSQVGVWGAYGSPAQGSPAALCESSATIIQRLSKMTPMERMATCPELPEARVCDAVLRTWRPLVGGDHSWCWRDFVPVEEVAADPGSTARGPQVSVGQGVSPISMLASFSSPAVVSSQAAMHTAAALISSSADVVGRLKEVDMVSDAPLAMDTSDSAAKSAGESTTQPLDCSSGGSAAQHRNRARTEAENLKRLGGDLALTQAAEGVPPPAQGSVASEIKDVGAPSLMHDVVANVAVSEDSGYVADVSDETGRGCGLGTARFSANSGDTTLSASGRQKIDRQTALPQLSVTAVHLSGAIPQGSVYVGAAASHTPSVTKKRRTHSKS